ncbi:MAG: hypothetical protein WCT04_15900 [Planctomycetota bacterium]
MYSFILAKTVCLLLVTFAAFAAESEPAIGPRASTFFITDYLPSAIYEGDTLSACFRVENVQSTKSTSIVSATSFDSTGAELKILDEKLGVASGAFAPVKFEFNAKRVARIRFDLKSIGEPSALASVAVILVRDTDAWPATRIINGRFVTVDSSSIVIPVVEKKRFVEERRLAPMKWFFGSGKEESVGRNGKCLAFAPGAWRLTVDSVHSLSPWALDGSVPIASTLNQIMSELRNVTTGEYKRCGLVLPPDDLDVATDPRTYRVVLDTLFARLAKADIGRVTVIAPYKHGCNDAHRKALWRELHESATINAVRVLDPLDWMSEAVWRADPNTPGVYARHPNAAGRKMIEQALADLIR